MSRPVCSVVVPSYRAASTIRACLTSLERQQTDAPFDIVVVDSSDDETPDIIRREFPAVRLLTSAARSDPAASRNRGVGVANGEYVAFLDADCVAPPGWLQRLLDTLHAGYDGAGGAIGNANPESLVSWAGYIAEFREFLPGGHARDAANLTLGNAAYRREAFRTAGGLPVGWFPQEDQVFHRVFLAHRFRLRFDPTIVVAHTHRTDLTQFLDHQHRIGGANAAVVQRLDLPGRRLVRSPALAAAALPAIAALRLLRTMRACWRVDGGRLLRRPTFLWFCWRGMWAWSRGFHAAARLLAANGRDQ